MEKTPALVASERCPARSSGPSTRCLVVIWSSTWVAIKIGLEDLPPLLGAGIRFALAGAGLLVVARLMGRPLRTDPRLAGGARAAAVRGRLRADLLGRAVRAVGAGRRAVRRDAALQRGARRRCCWPASRCAPRLMLGIAVALAGLSLAFGETLELGHSRYALAAAIACAAAPLASAIGNVAIKRGGGALDAVVLNGWAMLAGGALLLAVSALAEAWEVTWSARAVGSIAYLARDRLRGAVRDADDPAARAARGDDVLHHAAAAVRRARLRRRALRRAGHAARRRRRRARGLRAARRPVARARGGGPAPPPRACAGRAPRARRCGRPRRRGRRSAVLAVLRRRGR